MDLWELVGLDQHLNGPAIHGSFAVVLFLRIE